MAKTDTRPRHQPPRPVCPKTPDISTERLSNKSEFGISESDEPVGVGRLKATATYLWSTVTVKRN